MLRVGWFSTGNGAGSRRLLAFVMERVKRGDLPLDMRFVFSNREQGEHEGSDEFFALAKSYGLPLVTHSGRRFRKRVGGDIAHNRESYDTEVLNLIKHHEPQVLVLAGYMLISSTVLCNRYTMLNLHPALPGGPIGMWQDVIWELIETKASRAGAMMHLATEELDRGPVISYCSFPIQGPTWEPLWREVTGKPVAELKASKGEELPLFKAVRQAQLLREPYLVAETLRAFATGTVLVESQRVKDAKGREVSGVDLSRAIDAAIERDKTQAKP